MSVPLSLTWNVAERAGKSVFKKHTAPVMRKYIDDIIKAIEGGISSATPGSRCWPPKKDDAKVGIRLDWGTIAGKGTYRNLVIQVNADAEQSTFRKLAAGKDSHVKRGTVCLPIDAKGELAAPASLQLKTFLMEDVIDDAANGGI